MEDNGKKPGEATTPCVRKLRRLLTIKEVTELLGVTERHIRRLVNERRIPYVKWGHLLPFDPDEIAAWLDRARRPEEDSGATGRAS